MRRYDERLAAGRRTSTMAVGWRVIGDYYVKGFECNMDSVP